MMNGAVGYQLVDDGTPLSIGLIFGSAAALFVGTGYIALDTGFSWTGFFDSTLDAPNKSYSLYTLYQLVPLLFLVIYFLLEANLVLRVLGEIRPMSESPPRLNQSHYSNRAFKSTLSLLRSCLPLDRSSNMLSVFTFVTAPVAKSTEVSSRLFLRCCLLSQSGLSGQASRKMIGLHRKAKCRTTECEPDIYTI